MVLISTNQEWVLMSSKTNTTSKQEVPLSVCDGEYSDFELICQLGRL